MFLFVSLRSFSVINEFDIRVDDICHRRLIFLRQSFAATFGSEKEDHHQEQKKAPPSPPPPPSPPS
jgi:hypothetical protein